MRDLLKLHRQAVVTATTDAIGSRDYADEFIIPLIKANNINTNT